RKRISNISTGIGSENERDSNVIVKVPTMKFYKNLLSKKLIIANKIDINLAPRVGLEPTTFRCAALAHP
ncbi:MAG: hypothetical protein ACTSRR_03745, partial [Candidatus Heimdallarchaeaceae archaeon]